MQLKPFRIEMACGHLEIRLMREATAGRAFDPNAPIIAASSMYAECEPSKADLRLRQRALNVAHGLRDNSIMILAGDLPRRADRITDAETGEPYRDLRDAEDDD